MTKANTDIASALLEQHVKHELAALKGAKLKKFVANELDELFALTESVTLNRVSSVEQVMAVIQRIVISAAKVDHVPTLTWPRRC